MKADEVERCARLARRRIFSMGTVLQELPQKYFARARPFLSCINTRRVRAADLRLRQYLAHRRSRDIVEPVVLLRCAVPVSNIRLVPYLPKPAAHLHSVAIPQVRDIGFDQRAP